MKNIKNLSTLLLLCSLSSSASAVLLDFNDADNLGLIPSSNMRWSSIGGGHLYNDDAVGNDFIFFYSADTYVNSFEMNALPWQGFTRTNMAVGLIDIAALNAANETVWSTTVDLTAYTDWNDWLSIKVETASISQLTFFAPGILPHINTFWPSIDNMVINELPSQVPLPAAIWLFASGLAGLFAMRTVRS